MKQKNFILLILILLALHLLFVNSELLIKLLNVKHGFWNYSSKILFALSYSLITVLIIHTYPKPVLFILTAFLDGFAVFVNYSNMPDFHISVAVYFGIYTALIIVSTGLIVFNNENKTTPKENETNNFEDLDYSKLISKKISLQNSLNRLKNQEKKEVKQKELNAVLIRLEQVSQNFNN